MINNKEKNFVSAVVYVHNNENEIKYFLNQINDILYDKFEKYEIICVNDSSMDNSVSVIEQVSKEFENTTVNIINMSYYQGVEKSMLAGVDLAIGDFVYEFDSCIIDYDTDLLSDVYNKSLEGYDIVAASPTKNTNLLSSLYYFFINKFGGQNKLTTERFRIISRRGINRINQNTSNIIYRKAVYYNCGLNYFHIKYKSNGTYNFKGNFMYNQNLAVDSIIAFTNIGYRISFFITMLMMLFFIGTMIYSLIIRLMGFDVSAGWMTIIWIISFAFFMLFGLISVIIKYLSIIISLINNKMQYTYESINKINKN